MVNFKESQRKMVADMSEKVESAQKEFLQSQTTVSRLKKAYEAKCKEQDSTETELTNSVFFSFPLSSPLQLFQLFLSSIDENKRRRTKATAKTKPNTSNPK